jgi:PAS domain S-box-containing protein
MVNPDSPLDDAAARLAALVQASDDAIVSKTLEGIITSWNPAAEKLFGYSAGEAIGQPITMIIPPEHLGEEREVLDRIRRGESVEHLETVRVGKGGQRINITLTVSPIRTAAGEIIGASKIARDIGERQRADEMRAWLAALVQSSDDAIVSKTLESIITSWNPAAERMFGYTAAEAIGQSILIIIPPDRRQEEEFVLGRIRRGESVEHFDTVRVDRRGQRIPISLTVSPIRSAVGEIIGASKIARDITERKQAEVERTARLAHEQAARAELEALHRTKDQFLAVLSHELRTPVNAIFGWARMLQTSHLDPTTVPRAVEAIVRNATAQVQLVEDLLDLSRIVTGNMRLDVRSVNIHATVGAALDAVRPAAEAKGIRLQTILDPHAGPIMGAPDRLQQVMWNLLMNAVKFTPRGGRVQVHLARRNSHVEIRVSDTGQGISADLLPYIFDRFRQGDSSSTRAHGGLGIGLALVRHLVELHGGTVTADSAGEGRGASFTVRLPVAIMPVEPAAEETARTSVPGDLARRGERPLVSLRGLRVLVVDDDRDGLDLLSVVLTNAGAETRTSVSVAAALETLEQWPADVVVSDVEMPEEDGYALVRRLRALDARRARRTPTVALTAHGRAEDRRAALAAGFNLHLAKPIDPVELVLVIANLLGRTGT